MRKSAIAAAVLTVPLLLTGCGSADGPEGTVTESPAVPYAERIWYRTVLALLNNAAHPETGEWRKQVPGNPEVWYSFTYTPMGPGDPGYERRDKDGAVGYEVGFPSNAPDDEAKFLKCLTRDGTVVPGSLRVTRVREDPDDPDEGDDGFEFDFTVQLTDGTVLDGFALGDADYDKDGDGTTYNHVSRLTYGKYK
ncbi:hypothetical protein Afil01_25530 [Actinorhabdospora filicis]|uniref:Lipoprotein n=1 Tax=Actinorhabdospora filicis TaxID=1785913 RepID=A0A9W6SL42_9ACTN|nr:hypothetical protein [Actinorhabdospora filicis]GLZ77746.1 hypothetical protein Afil01_25530 [Actinorhabdospora filicis]